MSEPDTVRLKLRRWSPADPAPLAAMNADPVVMQFMPGRLSREASDACGDAAPGHDPGSGWSVRASAPAPGACAASSPALPPHPRTVGAALVSLRKVRPCRQ